MQKPSRRRFLARIAKWTFFLLLVAAVALFVYTIVPHVPVDPPEKEEKTQEKDHSSQLEKFDFQNGDIITRRGRGIWSAISPAFSSTDSRYSHIGIVEKTGEGLYVIHAHGDPDGKGAVSRDPIEDFLEDSVYWGLYRFRLSPEAIEKITNMARSYVEKGRTFDASFSLESEDALYCSELVWRAVHDAINVDLVPRKNRTLGIDFVGVDDIFLSDYLHPIK